MKKVACIHSTFVTVEDVKKIFTEKFPTVQLINIVDDSLLPEVLEKKQLTPGLIRRVCKYSLEAEALGASAVLMICTSLGEVDETVQKMLNIPFLRIDKPMMEKAVKLGSRIAVIASADSTLEPSARLVEKVARQSGKDVTVRRYFVEGAFDALLVEKDRDKHNRLIVDKVKQAAQENDVVVLAQGSMMHLLPLLQDVQKPVLTSVIMGVEQVQSYL